MDSPSSRPLDSIPTMGDHVYPLDQSLSYEHIYVARVSHILKAKRNIYKQNLLRELRHLRRLILAATPDQSLASPSQPTTRDHLLDPNLNSARDDNSEHLFVDETLDITSRTLLSSHELPRQPQDPSGHNSYRRQASEYCAFLGTSRNHSACEAHRSNINEMLSLRESPLEGQSPTDVARGEGHRNVESLSRSSMVDQNHAISVPQPLIFNNIPVLNDILLSYRRLNQMREAYCSTPSPSFFATYSTGAFSSAAPCDPLQTNTQLNLIDPKTMRPASSYQFSTRASPPTPTPQNGRNARTYRHRYVPPLLAKLFYEQEFSHLFDSNLRYTFSAQDTSLNKASEIYIRRLFPVPRKNSVLRPKLNHMPACVREVTAKSVPVSSENGRRNEASASYLEFPSRIEYKIPLSNRSKFQLHTFHHSLIPRTRHRVPVAQWHDDLMQKRVVLCAERPSQSHHAYAIALNDQGLPHYTDPQDGGSGVTPQASTMRAFPFQSRTNYPFRKTYGRRRTEKTCSGTHGIAMRAFGFQSRTNHPFRKTYGPPRTKEICSAPSNIPPRISPEFASRVPVGGLSTTLLQLCEPGISHGLFFNEDYLEFSVGLESNGAKVLYSICEEGRLVPDGTDE